MWRTSVTLLASVALLPKVLGTDILHTSGFTDCNNGSSTIKVNNVDISFDRSTNDITFDVSGSSEEEQKVTASLIVTAYGINVYQKDFDPCAEDTKVDQLCPVPKGDFSATGTQQIPSDYASKIPSIAYSVPDLDGDAKMILKSANGQEVACVQAGVSNGKTVELPAVSYVAAAIAAAALALSLVGGAMSGSHPGASHSSPGFSEVMWWFQGLAMNGMHSVNYPSVYRSFSKNFAFSTGLIPWGGLQTSIDNFRKHTGGNLTDANYGYLKNATLIFPDNTTEQTQTSVARRGLFLLTRAVQTSVNGTNSGSSGNSSSSQNSEFVKGIQGYVEELTVPAANTFMTVLLIFAIVVAAIVVGILLFKVILETWALWGKFPASLSTFRKEYWRIMAQTIISLILLLYGIWTLYCIFQFTHGDSWAAKLLAGLTLGIFTAILAFYTWKIFSVAHKMKKMEGTSQSLFEDKETWKKYKLFYENYKSTYWWLFVPAIVYMFAKGCVLAAGDGHGLFQTAGQLIIESLMLILLLWSRPYNRKSGNWINIIIQVVRVLSVICILIFVEELGIAQTTKTITGVVLIVVQSALTAILAILIAINSIITCCKENPHRKKRKAAAEMVKEQDLEGDAFLLQPQPYTNSPPRQRQMVEKGGYEPMRSEALERFRSRRQESQDMLVGSGASMGKSDYHTVSQTRSVDSSPPPTTWEPTLPRLGTGPYRDYMH